MIINSNFKIFFALMKGYCLTVMYSVMCLNGALTLSLTLTRILSYLFIFLSLSYILSLYASYKV